LVARRNPTTAPWNSVLHEGNLTTPGPLTSWLAVPVGAGDELLAAESDAASLLFMAAILPCILEDYGTSFCPYTSSKDPKAIGQLVVMCKRRFRLFGVRLVGIHGALRVA
jgi:hypothetical protein